MVRTLQSPRFPRFSNLPALFLAALCVANGPGTAVAAQDVNATDRVTGALQALQMIDQGRSGDLWDGAAPAARKRIGGGDFVAEVAKARETPGAVVREMVGFQLGSDRVWRFSGYFIQ